MKPKKSIPVGETGRINRGFTCALFQFTRLALEILTDKQIKNHILPLEEA